MKRRLWPFRCIAGCVLSCAHGEGEKWILDLKKSMPGEQRLGEVTATNALLLILTACSRRVTSELEECEGPHQSCLLLDLLNLSSASMP
jgi:hypothetical protein